mgnify:CR=1 FL=1
MNLKDKPRPASAFRAAEGLIRNALKEDIVSGDITSELLLPKNKKIKAIILLKEEAVIAGLRIAEKVFKTVDNKIKFKAQVLEGSLQKKGKIIAVLEGSARHMLLAERTALNFLAHLSGIATLVRSFAFKVKPYKVKIMDTRKTIPGLRNLQKYAVYLGGGYSYRMGLWDEILIKDNHIAASCLRRHASGVMPQASCVEELIETIKKKRPKDMKIEIEVKNLKEFMSALKAQPDIIMLDNMKIADIRKAVAIRLKTQDSLRLRSGQARLPAVGGTGNTLLEASGGVNLDNVRTIAATGVDMISIGCLTHSVKAIDISLEITHCQ